MSHVWGVPEENRLEEDRQHLFFIPGAAEWEAPGWKPSNTRTAARGPTLLISSHAIEKLGLDAGLYWTNWSWGSEAKPGWVSTQVVFVNVTLQLLVDLMNVGLVIKGNSTDLTCQCQVICYDYYSACKKQLCNVFCGSDGALSQSHLSPLGLRVETADSQQKATAAVFWNLNYAKDRFKAAVIISSIWELAV